MYGDLATWVNDGLVVNVALLDFSKVFDEILDDILLQKLKARSLDDHLLQWIWLFLAGQSMQVMVDE